MAEATPPVASAPAALPGLEVLDGLTLASALEATTAWADANPGMVRAYAGIFAMAVAPIVCGSYVAAERRAARHKKGAVESSREEVMTTSDAWK